MTDTVGTGGGPCPCGPCLARAQAKHIRAWRWLTALDLTSPPAPVLRYIGILIVAVVYLGLGARTPLADWLWAAVIAGFLILPDVAGFGVAGVRLDLKQAQDEIATLRQEVNAQARASSTAGIAIGNDAVTAFTESLTRAATQAIRDQASGVAAPWPEPGTGTQPT